MPTMTKEYMNNYMKKKREENPLKHKLYAHSLKIKKKYNVDNELWEKYKEHLGNVYKILEVLKETPIDIVNDVIINREKFKFNE